MVTKGLLVRLEAKHGKEAEVEQYLTSALPLVHVEPATLAWFARAAPIRSWEEGEDRSWTSQGPMAVHVVPHAGRWRRFVDLEPRSPQGAHPE
jgi:hypothetical protein